MHGAPVWAELATEDVESAKTFFAATLGWTYRAMPMRDGEYWIASSNGKPVAGIILREPFEDDDEQHRPEGDGPVPGDWLCYIGVDDVDKAVAAAKDNGGQVVQEPFNMPGVGRIAIIEDASGALIGWMQPLPADAPAQG